MDLHKASNQWAARPAEERFWTLDELSAACTRYKSEAVETEPKPLGYLTVEGDPNTGADMVLKATDTGNKAELSHYAFNQLCGYIGAPAGYLRTLRPDLARLCVKNGISMRVEDDEPPKVSMLLNKNGDLKVRALTSERYARIWNADVVQRVLPLQGQGWRVAPARPSGQVGEVKRLATEADLLKSRSRIGGLGIQVGMEIAPAGLYASDRDLFAFLVNEDREIGDTGLFRGFFVENSEVGDRAFRLTTFLYNAVCGNHIVWGAKEVNEARIIHIGKAGEKANYELDLRKYADGSDSEDQAKIEKAKTYILAGSQIEAVDRLFAKQIGSLTMLKASYDEAVQHPADCGGASPLSAWGFAQGITRLSQAQAYTADRVKLDQAAGKVLKMAF